MSVDSTDDGGVDEDEEMPKKLRIKKENLSNIISRDFFTILDWLTNFWIDSDEYNREKYIVKNINVVNDSAEKGIKLVQE